MLGSSKTSAGAAGDEVTNEALLLFSDVHLGSDLNDSGKSVPRSKAIDDDLTALLAHYRKVGPPAPSTRWRIVIAGDFIDFIGISIDPQKGDTLATELTHAEREFGLGGAEDHVLLKMRRTAKRHANVFAELGAFVAEGHTLTAIQGNHDLELHWPSVQREFVEQLAVASGSTSPTILEDIASRVEFRPWFFHRAGLVFIEHGHQYDSFCATPFILAPLCPRDPRRINPTLSDNLLRHIVRRTPGMKEYGHENRGLTSYISWGLMLGARGTLDLFRRFFYIVGELRSIARAYASENGKKVRDQHESRLDSLVESSKISKASLRDALALHVTPLAISQKGVLASVMLDRLSVVAIMIFVLIVIASLWSRLGAYALPMLVSTLVLWAIVHVVLSRGRPSIDPSAIMENRAVDLARLFPSSFVVMGHTHVPATKAVAKDVTYINLGSWAEEEPDPSEDMTKAYRAARTHLVIHDRGDRHEAHLYAWHAGEGPREQKAVIRPLRTDEEVPIGPATAESAAE